ncbi:SDR family oxidoreductase [Clostridium thailandense]|uniref:SDR family oxidoreductase n=1 Tax=Clostridium thailandense TaxID=2794346 RepID=UPI0028AA288E|nr:SDR family oxidoreductase [Clostridium thailandense]
MPNKKGVYFLTQNLLPYLADNGRIINFSSGLARFTTPGWSAYASMKGAVEVMTRYMAKELCSDEMGWITGERIEASGGMLL